VEPIKTTAKIAIAFSNIFPVYFTKQTSGFINKDL